MGHVGGLGKSPHCVASQAWILSPCVSACAWQKSRDPQVAMWASQALALAGICFRRSLSWEAQGQGPVSVHIRGKGPLRL